ncbi:hypothetical protein GCM10010218_32910 [Streptomyces mashuensis]|uniref:CHAT domain-containing protein n=1 Tax=Streptomyces mashuensis TaxID=33904 RepID=A0A919EDF8_9ACTN|nr:CHAT domain-containing protein [Streptomyces mashuensis]GHF48840.1 hypothetical protein GCM10010218_32910 [Streptomyces mashuensis]
MQDAKPYDLDALMNEVRQLSADGLVTGEDLTRVVRLLLDRLGCATAEEAYDRLYEDWRALPRGTLASGLRAGQVLCLLPLLLFESPVNDGREKELLAEARAHGPADAQWQSRIIGVSTTAGIQQLSGPAEAEAALARVEEARALLPPDSPLRDLHDLMHASLRGQLAQLGGGADDLDSAVEDLARLVDSPVLAPEQRLFVVAQLATFRAHQAARREDEAGLAEQIQVLESVLAGLPADHMERIGLQAQLDRARGSLVMLRAERTGRFEPETGGVGAGGAPVEEVRRQIAALPRDAQADKLVEAGLSRGVGAMAARDPRGLGEALALLDDALGLVGPDDERWMRCAHGMGTVHYALGSLPGVPLTDRRRHFDQGVSWFRHSLAAARGPEHPLWGRAGMTLAVAYRMRGQAQMDRRVARRNFDEARRVGLDALRATSWGVLLQSGTAHAAESGRYAAEHVLDLARWCVADGAYEDAVRALDAGRGLVLHAATVSATVPEMLVAAGETALAEEWRAAGAAPPPLDAAGLLPSSSGPSSRLRRRVLKALAESPAQRRLFEAPHPREIGAALGAVGATALVYLVPAGETEPGTALVVARDGSVTSLPLPGLSVDAPALTAYRATGTPGRDAGGPPTAGGHDRDALARLCAWAGETVMEPLLGALPRGYGSAPSVVLVPMGELGLVPWHAARVRDRRGRAGYACQQAQISYVPSARLLCEVAARPRAAGARQALVVGNPTHDLRHAGEEAEAVHRVFHPDGELLGPGTATPAAVTGWLGRQRGGLLHLACHGRVRQGARHSAYLSLAGGTLAAEELTEGTARYRDLDVVVLAACRTNVSGHGYDEAYSLSTAFLVAGARSVIGSLWPVPDDATSLLMYMTHHYLVHDALPPGRALRAAQLWMLDDGRVAPPGMPERLAEQVRCIKGDELVAWAGFTHLGW